MTVLHLLGSPGDGGAETYFLSLAAGLKADGLSQAVALHANKGREAALKAMGVPATVMPFDAPFDLVTGRRIRALAEALPARILLQWMNRAGRVVPRRGPWTRIGRLGGYYDLKYYKGADFLVANTRDIQAYIVRKGWPADRVAYIPNFATPGPEAAQSRAALETPEDAPLLLGMGRLHKVKAHDVSLKALGSLSRSLPLDRRRRRAGGLAEGAGGAAGGDGPGKVPRLAGGRLGPLPRRRRLPVPLPL